MKPKAENRITGTLGEGVGCVSIEGLEMLVRKWGIWILHFYFLLFFKDVYIYIYIYIYI